PSGKHCGQSTLKQDNKNKGQRKTAYYGAAKEILKGINWMNLYLKKIFVFYSFNIWRYFRLPLHSLRVPLDVPSNLHSASPLHALFWPVVQMTTNTYATTDRSTSPLLSDQPPL
ncbi:unnamed protein product, partial [Wuchereria bancrofti]